MTAVLTETLSLFEAVRVALSALGLVVDVYALAHVESGIRAFPRPLRRRVLFRRRWTTVVCACLHALFAVHGAIGAATAEAGSTALLYVFGQATLIAAILGLLSITAVHVEGWIGSEEILGPPEEGGA